MIETKRIYSIVLENYRQYKGEKKIELSTSEEQNFTIIQGANGAGKTNLVNAITWCLYDDEQHLSNVSKTIDPVSASALNDLGKNKIISMKVRITLGDSRPQYTIERVARLFKGEDGKVTRAPTSFKIMFLPENGRDWVEHQNPTLLINALLPKGISGFFLFDGERLDDFFKEESRENVKKALLDVSQISLINSALKRMSDVKNAIRQNTKGFSSKADEYQSKIEQNTRLLTQVNKEYEDYQKQLERIRRDINDIDRRFAKLSIKEIKKLQEERDQITKIDLKRLEKRQDDAKQRLIDTIIAIGPTIYAQNAIKKTMAEIERKYKKGELPPKIREEYINDLLKSGECICGTDISKEGPHRRNVKRQLQAALFSQIDEEVKEGKFTIKEMLKKGLEFPDSSGQWITRIRETNEEIASKNKRLKEISTLVEEFLKEYGEQGLAKLESERTRLESAKDQANQDIGRVKGDVERIKKEILENETLHRKELEKGDKNSDFLLQIDFCGRAIEVLEKVKENMINETRAIIQEWTKKYFLDLVWKKDTFKDVRIGEDYSLSVIHEGGWDAVGSLSAGERQLLALSFISALQKVSGFDFPILIDTPLGRISGDPKDNIAKLLPTFLSKTQVTMLVTDQEYTDSVRNKMKKRIGKEYILAYNEKKDETVVKQYAN